MEDKQKIEELEKRIIELEKQQGEQELSYSECKPGDDVA